MANVERLSRRVDFAGELIASGYKFARMRTLFLGDRFAKLTLSFDVVRKARKLTADRSSEVLRKFGGSARPNFRRKIRSLINRAPLCVVIEICKYPVWMQLPV